MNLLYKYHNLSYISDDNNDTRQETLTKLRGYLETFCNNSAKLNYIDNMTKQLLSIEDGNREELIAVSYTTLCISHVIVFIIFIYFLNHFVF